MKRLVPAVLFVTALASLASGGPFITITAVPPTASGAPGNAVGWGFQFDSTTDYWVELNNSYFIGAEVDGTYVDYVAGAGYIFAPHATQLILWDPLTFQGLGEYDLTPTAPLYTLIPGEHRG
jgi:hypothetical protein